MGTLDNKVALVTGGAQGIGYAVVQKLASEGARILVVDLDEAAAAAVKSELGDAVTTFTGDLLDPAVPGAAVDAAVEGFGGLDIIVNNAGFHWDSMLHKMTDEQWQAMLDIHVTVPFRILRAAAPHLFAAAAADAAAGVEVMRKVVNVSSLAASFGNIGAANYSAAKAGVIGLTKALAKEWGPHKINVNAAAFGIIQTRFGLPQGEQNRITVGGREVQMGVPHKTLAKRGVTVDPGREYSRDEIYKPRPFKQIPLGRAGHITEAAGAVYFLCSPLSDYVTGQVVSASGGASGGMS
ncbi:SDR family NAD(P)-dependent oxidoreductase [Sphingopyxis indica]|uniref:3-oxoacyl-[acyl-carrier protein] reductase n=1 Tax=Sphingopyxis indica TaxID=436663 RepID=A0A239HBQ2_9SPHN|nr:SDR family NAD(P)-dependent oxidoreductase [Sphingopyxis indica]SNS78712.1 3-oxoacyl-[acyl-carrier protein] reductase [Sphingopyxis indica]